tara:strand:- start:325 stop:1437 length:1113 start_codon:yes stop_codon:yes gene_type:complete
MLSSLDPHSSFLDPSEYEDLKESTSGKFGGLGIEVTMDESFIRVVSPIDNTPAFKAGVAAGDLIIRIDGASTKGLSLRKAVDIMRGEAGTDIELTIVREGEDTPLTFTITRDIIQVDSIRHKMLAKDYGYIRISQFQSKTGRQFKEALESLQDETESGHLKGLVLDLRNNPGGIFEASVEVADALIDADKLSDNKMLVYTEGRLPGAELKEQAHRGDMLEGAPVAVLINGGSASASEIVAGALQDHRRAVIMGTQSFGKGSVQTVLPLDEEYGLKLTTALYFTPNGRSIQAKGIEPDISIENITLPDGSKRSSAWSSIKESDLKGHLENTVEGDEAKVTTEEKFVFEPIADYQVQEALNLLKGLSILSSS